MQTTKIRNLSRPEVPDLDAGYCTSFLCRLRGLTFRRSLPPNWGLLLVGRKPSRSDASIHMLFMFLDLAVIWIDEAYCVVDVRKAWRWRSIIVPQTPAKYVLELPIEAIDVYEVGDELAFETH